MLLSIIFLATVFFYSCEKEQASYRAIVDNNFVDTRTSDGSSLQSKIDRVKGFQRHLQDLQSGQSTTSSYTVEEATYGLEYLFNYAYGDIQIGVNLGGAKTSFPVPSNNNWLELYNDIFTQIEEEKNPDLSFDFVTVEFNSETHSVELHTHYLLTNPEIVEYLLPGEGQSFGCDNPPFANQEFIFGTLGPDGEIGVPTVCEELAECGENIACAIPNTFALDIIDAFYNAEIRYNNFCKNGDVAAYTEIGDILIGISEDSSISRIAANCPEITNDIGHPNACDCASTDILNCLFCHTDAILNQEDILQYIPEGLEIININLFTESITPGGEVYYQGLITYGTIICVPNEREETPLFVDICC